MYYKHCEIQCYPIIIYNKVPFVKNYTRKFTLTNIEKIILKDFLISVNVNVNMY